MKLINYQWSLPFELRMVKSRLLMRQNTINQIPIWTLQEKGTEKHRSVNQGEGKCSGVSLSQVVKAKQRKNALIVLTAGLLLLLRWALILLNFCNTAEGLNVLLLAWKWESAAGKVEEELEAMVGWENAVPIEVTSSSKATKACSIVFWEVEERANLREYWFCCELVSSVASWFAWMHWCCFLVWWTAKNGSFLCCCFVKETEYPFFMSIQNRWRTTPLVCWLPWRFQIINNNNSYWS